ncbi:cell division protein SepF [Acidaminobacter hydrogenoformans]|uniref:Cell division protein SepF n=1 Tax=Acidaminobacter hydrogenoformans DSM 2784 TaxID=1120920 RepID=A0A1G5RSE7_9FIRM|nr:cell division protein SepF [Acidaminobacter hydrogenoformans]SCZ76994.1 cell division inhibitor SepF [Acidaminobacter hydrogenoformans DSM 2784]
MAEKFIDKVRSMMGFETSMDEEVYEEDFAEDEDGGYERGYAGAPASYSNPNKVVNLHKSQSMKVVLYQPRDFEDTRAVIDSLKGKKPVILNIEELDPELARKIFDFCSGALYAIDGHIQKVSRGIFILAPSNVDISGDVRGELENKGVFAWSARKDGF